MFKRTLSTTGSGYMVDYVSVKAGETTQLKANFLPNNAPIDPQFTAANIKFRNSKGEELAATYTAPTWAITLPAAGAGEDEVFAFWTPPSGTPKSVGKLLVKRYEEKTKKLQIVRVGSVGSVDGTAIAAALNDIYKPALTKWEVSVVSKDIKFDYKDGVMNAEGLASFSNYSAEMKELITTYFSGNRVDDPNTYYLFVVPGFTPSNVQGYMPRGRNVGFVSDVSARNMAHELGHGAFGLRHTFDEQPESKSNLLDYGSESYLTAAQWQQIQNPGIILNWFDDMEDAEYETDGHYSTVYLVGLMLGMSQAEAQELAKYTEQPDTYVHSPIDFELNDTWSYPNQQTETHSLTNGFHGTEELLTALKFLFTPNTNKVELGRLLHRYGDTYAHTRLDNATFPIQADDFSQQEKQLIYLEAWKNIAGEKLDQKLDPWIKYVNLLRQRYGINLLTNKEAQKQYLNGKTLMEYLYEVNKFHPSDNFEMYGNEPVKMFGFKLFQYTFQHMIEDKAMPDFIYVRPKWYLTYVQNLAHLLSVKFGLSIDRLDLKKFEQMVSYITPKNITMKGIIDYEIAKAIRQNYVDVPVFYASQTHLIATADATVWSNYSDIAKQVVANTKTYMSEVDNRPYKRVEEKRKTISIVNSQTGAVSKASYIITYRIHF